MTDGIKFHHVHQFLVMVEVLCVTDDNFFREIILGGFKELGTFGSQCDII